MKKWSKKFGFISIETVIVGSIILGIGILGVMSLGSTGSKVVSNGLDKLDSLNLFNDNGSVVDKYDENGYLKTLNIDVSEINPVEEFEFEWNDSLNGWTIVAHHSSDTSLVIPVKNSDGLPIVKISEALYAYKNIESLALPNGIVEIESGAFYGNSLTTVAFPDSILTIGSGSFSDNQLVSISFSDNLRTIHEAAFSGNHLTSVVLPNKLENIGSGAFSGNNLTEIVLPNSLLTAGSAVFRYNPLTHIEFKGNVPASYIDRYGNEANSMFYEMVLNNNTVKVPSSQLQNFIDSANFLGVENWSAFYE